MVSDTTELYNVVVRDTTGGQWHYRWLVTLEVVSDTTELYREVVSDTTELYRGGG